MVNTPAETGNWGGRLLKDLKLRTYKGGGCLVKILGV